MNSYTPRALKDVHLPLAYSPITKQLHLISDTDENSKRPKDSLKPESCSHGSTVSSLSDVSPSAAGENGDLSSIGNCSLVSEDEQSDKPKKKSLTGLFSR